MTDPTPFHTGDRRAFLVRSLALAGAGAAPWFVRDARAADTNRFALGVASGCPQAESVVLWTRLVGEDLPEQVSVQWEIARDEGFTQIVARGVQTAERADAHSVHVQPRELAPARWYWYRFQALGQRSAVGRTRTAPPAGTMESLRFALASCQRWDHGEWAAWREVASRDLDLVVFVGDYIYESAGRDTGARRHPEHEARTLADYRARYALYKSDPALQDAHARMPWIVTWDDHEVENDYARDTPEVPDAHFAQRRAAATQAYWEHMPLPMSARPRGTQLPLHARYEWGALARIHVLDNRQFRDPQVCPKPGRNGSNTLLLRECPQFLDARRSMLGVEQERWLAQGLDAQRWNLVAQQTLMARSSWRDTTAPDTRGGMYWSDGWDGYAPARQRFLDSLSQRGVNSAVVLSGDVHAHYVADLLTDFDNPSSRIVASEICGTSISSRGLEQSRIDAALRFNPHIHYARSDQRGCVVMTLGEHELAAELLAVDDVHDPRSTVRTAARFSVEAGRPGIQPRG